MLSDSTDTEKKEVVFSNSLVNKESMTCSYPQLLSTYFQDNEITYSLPEKETNPIIFTFSKNLNTDNEYQVSYIDATKIISTEPIFKILENDDKIVFIEGTGENYMTVHTIWKKEGIGTYIKNVDILGIKSASLAMGSCVGY